MMHANYQMKSMERALASAARGGHAELVNLVLDRGALMITEVSEKTYISISV